MNKTFTLEAVTPVFSYGANQSVPEIRPASVRGTLHWWFRALGGSFDDERHIFGGISIGGRASPTGSKLPDHAGRVVVRVSAVEGDTGSAPTLPHKHGGRAAVKPCYLPGTRFRLHLIDRLGGLDGGHRDRLLRAVDAWLLAGGFGTRATRGGGAFQSLDPPAPESPAAWQAAADRVFAQSPCRAVLLPALYADATEARADITDTIGGQFDRPGGDSLARISHPLGVVTFGKGGRRKTSPLRLTLRRFGDGYRIVAVWDGRGTVTGNRPEHLSRAADLLTGAGKPLGPLLQRAFA